MKMPMWLQSLQVLQWDDVLFVILLQKRSAAVTAGEREEEHRPSLSLVNIIRTYYMKF